MKKKSSSLRAFLAGFVFCGMVVSAVSALNSNFRADVISAVPFVWMAPSVAFRATDSSYVITVYPPQCQPQQSSSPQNECDDTLPGCNDHFDNNDNSLIDCADPKCQKGGPGEELGSQPSSSPIVVHAGAGESECAKSENTPSVVSTPSADSAKAIPVSIISSDPVTPGKSDNNFWENFNNFFWGPSSTAGTPLNDTTTNNGTSASGTPSMSAAASVMSAYSYASPEATPLWSASTMYAPTPKNAGSYPF